jgi:hypothetical protein
MIPRLGAIAFCLSRIHGISRLGESSKKRREMKRNLVE